MTDPSSYLDREINFIEQLLLSLCIRNGLPLVPQNVLREAAKSLVIAQRQEARKLTPNIDLAAVMRQLEEINNLIDQPDCTVSQEIKNRVATIKALLENPKPLA